MLLFFFFFFFFWHQIFIIGDFLLFIAHYLMLLQATHSMCRDVVCFGTLNNN